MECFFCCLPLEKCADEAVNLLVGDYNCPEELRICEITSPLQAKRLMQKLQLKLQVPRPNTASLFTRCQPSSVEKGTTWTVTRSVSHEQMWHTAELPTSPF